MLALQTQDSQNRVGNDQSEGKGCDKGDGEAHSLKKPGAFSLRRGSLDTVTVKQDDQDSRDIDRGDGFRTGDDGRHEHTCCQEDSCLLWKDGSGRGLPRMPAAGRQGLRPGRSRSSGGSILRIGRSFRSCDPAQKPDEDHKDAEEIAGDDQGPTAGKLPDLTDDRESEEGAGSDGIQEDPFPFSVQQIEKAGESRACQHQEAYGEKLVQKRDEAPEGKQFFPENSSPPEILEPDGIIHIKRSAQVIGSECSVEHGEAIGSEGIKEKRDPVSLPACNFICVFFDQAVHSECFLSWW